MNGGMPVNKTYIERSLLSAILTAMKENTRLFHIAPHTPTCTAACANALDALGIECTDQDGVLVTELTFSKAAELRGVLSGIGNVDDPQ